MKNSASKITCFLLFLTTALLFIACTPNPVPVPPPPDPSWDGHRIKPNGTQEQLNKNVRDKYDAYKARFLKPAANGKYYIEATGNGEGGETAVTISEAHGYGMMIFALMADQDADARKYFDGMNALRKAQRSTGNPDLMSWIVIDPNSNGIATEASATDGDLDNAYALLLAHKKWGDNKYLEDAKILIDAIKKSSMHQKKLRTALGDWNQDWGNRWTDTKGYPTRSSDWMPGHFRAFAKATNDNFWNQVADNVYNTLIPEVANKITGLLPCFGTDTPLKPDPKGGETGEENADKYWWNACRDPWRLATDYIHHKTPAAQVHINKISSWLIEEQGIDNINNGYELDGTPIGSWKGDMAFVAPFAAGMIADSSNQASLNSIYKQIVNENGANVYGAAIQLLCMLLITDNWDAPN